MLLQDNSIKQWWAWMFLGWVTGEWSCPCTQLVNPVTGGGLKITWNPLIFKSQRGYSALTLLGINMTSFKLLLSKRTSYKAERLVFVEEWRNIIIVLARSMNVRSYSATLEKKKNLNNLCCDYREYHTTCYTLEMLQQLSLTLYGYQTTLEWFKYSNTWSDRLELVHKLWQLWFWPMM